MINQVENLSFAYSETFKASNVSTVRYTESLPTTTSKVNEINTTEQPAAVYEPSQKESPKPTYSVDFEKVKSMKEETERRMISLFTKTIDQGFLKQVGGLRGVLEKIINGESVEGIDIEVTDESIAQAQKDVAEGGYWSPEATSDRFIEFATALSGGDKSKADLLIDAFKEGYAMAEELWGGDLPEISQKTYDLTLEKFDAWQNEVAA